MEEFAVSELIKQIKNEKFTVKMIIHDRDAGTRSQFEKAFCEPYQSKTVIDCQESQNQMDVKLKELEKKRKRNQRNAF